MGFYSQADIVRAVDDKIITINSKGREANIAAASIHLSLAHLYRLDPLRTEEFDNLLYEEERLHQQRPFADYTRLCELLDFKNGYEVVETRQLYLAESEEDIEIPNHIRRMVTSRSSYARLFLWIEDDVSFTPSGANPSGVYSGRVPLLLRTLGPGVKVYKGDQYAQLFLRDDESFLWNDQLVEVLRRGEVKVVREGKVQDPRDVLDYENSCLVLTLDKKIRVIQCSKPFDPREDSASYFYDLHIPSRLEKNPLVLPAGTNFLAATAERVELSGNYIGELGLVYRPLPLYGMQIHPNCPFHQPGSKGKIILECHADTDVRLVEGMPVAMLRIWRMNSPAEYNGMYADQDDVATSRAHKLPS